MTNEQRMRFEERLSILADTHKYFVERCNEETSKKRKHDYECIYKGLEGQYLEAVRMVEILGLINDDEAYKYLDRFSFTK